MSSVQSVVDRLKAQSPVEHVNGVIHREHRDSERYEVDFASDFKSDGWLQFDTDQDAWYFGVWVNPVKFLVLTYAEGDWSLVVCSDKDAYNREIGRLCEFHGATPELIAVDLENKQAIHVYQDRKQFLAS